MYAKNGFRVGFGHVGMQKTVVLVAKNGFAKMKFFGCRSVLTRFTNVANSENAFSCGFCAWKDSIWLFLYGKPGNAEFQNAGSVRTT